MAARNKPTWIAVLDAAQARFFALRKTNDGQVFEKSAETLNADRTREERGGKPGRSFSSAHNGVRHAIEPHKNFRKLEKHNFMVEVAEALDEALGAGRYAQLVLVVPPRSLGELREILPERVLKAVMLEVPKNLTKLAPDALWTKLSAHFLKGAKSLNGAEESTEVEANGAAVPLSIVFRNMVASPTVHADAVRLADRLGRKFGRIVNCRVTIEASHHPYRKVKVFRVSIDLKLPGREIAAKSAKDIQRVQEDVKAALRDAFDAATRQLQDYVVRRKKGGVAETRRSASLRTLATA